VRLPTEEFAAVLTLGRSRHSLRSMLGSFCTIEIFNHADSALDQEIKDIQQGPLQIVRHSALHVSNCAQTASYLP
jgi:hypothetical protein